MPKFIVTQQDEANWKKAKDAAATSKKKSQDSFTDQDWALTNHIYQKMKKNEDYNDLIKADSDEDEADQWLKENETQNNEGEDYDEYGEDEDEDAHQKGIKEDVGFDEVDPEEDQLSEKDKEQKEKVKHNLYPDPTQEELDHVRPIAHNHVHRATTDEQLNADPKRNPKLAHRGEIVAATHLAGKDRNEAYNKLISSEAYKNADPKERRQMDRKFKEDWNKPRDLGHFHEANDKGKLYQDLYNKAQRDIYRNLLGGGAASGEDMFSDEEGIQHAGGTTDDEGVKGVSIMKPQTSTFADQSPEALKGIKRKLDAIKVNLSPEQEQELENFEKPQRSINEILGQGVKGDYKYNQIYNRYEPLLRNAHKVVLRKLGIENNPELSDYLRGRGDLGLTKALAYWDPSHPSKKSFKSFARDLIHYEMMKEASKQDMVPKGAREEQKAIDKQAVKVKPTVTPSVTPTQVTPVAESAPQQVEPQPKKIVRRAAASKIIQQSNHKDPNEALNRYHHVSAIRGAMVPPHAEEDEGGGEEDIGSFELPSESPGVKADEGQPSYTTPKPPTTVPQVSKLVRRK